MLTGNQQGQLLYEDWIFEELAQRLEKILCYIISVSSLRIANRPHLGVYTQFLSHNADLSTFIKDSCVF